MAVVDAVPDVVDGAGVVEGVDAVDEEELVAEAVAEVVPPSPLAVASSSRAPAEQEAVRVTARAAAVTAASGRMSAECRSP
ncbi:hypothetical protein GCM10009867_03900 [Pedococcus aerophilus]|uniref:Uncharacterized protein n=1 Tax=Pedococcus aerophilus TaxID=436356 RepID=A0ABP6GY15_9MICO